MKKIVEFGRPSLGKVLPILIVAALIGSVAGCGIPDDVYRLTLTSTGGGVVTAPGEDTFEYSAGTVVELEAVAEEGHGFVSWTGDVGTVADPEAAETTITMDGDYSVMANFAAVFNLSISSTDGGSVTSPGLGTFEYSAGTVVELEAVADEGYRFVSWTGDVGTVADPEAAETTITMDGDYAITANFEYEGVYFADPNLEAAVREAIGVSEGPIYPEDLAELEYLSAERRGISDLTGLEHLTSLTELSFRWNQISDISPLAGLTKLTRLHLWSNEISDITPLTNLTNLNSLSLPYNEISDISPLANLTNLTSLFIEGNEIGDISALAGLTGVTWLNSGSNQIGDVSALASLTNLKHLWLASNQISDISPLASLTGLSSLGVSRNPIGDLSSLANLTNLTHLRLGGIDLDDGGLRELVNLIGADLTTLHLDSNQIGDVSPLTGLTGLTHLRLSSNQVVDISPLASLTGLTQLYLRHNRISDISPLVGLTSLEVLDLGSNEIADISPVAGLTNLLTLELGSNRISDIEAVSGLTGLLVLYLGENEISDITPVSGLVNLGSGTFQFYRIEDGQVIHIDLSRNQIADISALVLNKGLAEGAGIDLRWNPLSEESIDEHIPALETRGVRVYY